MRRAAESTRDDHDLHADMARTLLAEQHYMAEAQSAQADEALEYLTAALVLQPSNPVTLRLAARAHALAGEPTEASFRFGAALESDVTLEPALTADGDALDQLLLASSLGQAGRGVSAHAALGRARAMIGDEGATEVLRAVLDTVRSELQNTQGDGND